MDKIIAAKSAGREPAPDPLDVLFDFLIEENGSIGTIVRPSSEDDMNLAHVAALVFDRLGRIGTGDRKDRCGAAIRTPAISAHFPACWVNTSRNASCCVWKTPCAR